MENKNYDSILNECIDKTEKLTISDKKPNKGTGSEGSNKIKTNKGTGAGGSNTNKNGLPYEKITELKNEYTIIDSKKHYKKIKFNNSDKEFIIVKQSGLFKYMENKINKDIVKAHGCKNPDECFIDELDKRIFIIEKKFQQTGGSVCEKIQTSNFKIWQYSRTFCHKYKIIFCYCLSNWFKENCKAEIEYLKFNKVPVFWGSDENYKKDIVKFILNFEKNQKTEENDIRVENSDIIV
tara:strand:+ start:76 stop:786 length:711 start_codon:yes stop_codon:yes gene_type:complete